MRAPCRLHPWCGRDVRWSLPGAALFPHPLHAPGSTVLFKPGCCFSSTRDIISVHTAQFIGVGNTPRSLNSDSTRSVIPASRLAVCARFSRYLVLPVLLIPPKGQLTITTAAKPPFCFVPCLFHHPSSPSSRSASVQQQRPGGCWQSPSVAIACCAPGVGCSGCR